jgi:hypothetical protein
MPFIINTEPMKLHIRILICVGLVCAPFLITAQNYKQAFKNDICDCLSQKEMSIRQYLGEYQRCYVERLPNHVGKIEASLPDTTARVRLSMSSKIKQDLRLSLQAELAGSCQRIIDLYAKKQSDNLDAIRKKADSSAFARANQKVALSPNVNNLLARAMVYLGQDKIELANQDVQGALELNPRSRYAQIVQVLLLEQKKQYSEAIQVLQKMSKGKYDRDVNMHIAYLEYLQNQ